MANRKPFKHAVHYHARILYYDAVFIKHHGYVGRVLERKQDIGECTMTGYAYSSPVSAVSGAWKTMNEMCGIQSGWDPRKKAR